MTKAAGAEVGVLARALMTSLKLLSRTLNMLIRLEWSGVVTEQGGHSYPACPVCDRVRSDRGYEDEVNATHWVGHTEHCELKKLIRALRLHEQRLDQPYAMKLTRRVTK